VNKTKFSAISLILIFILSACSTGSGPASPAATVPPAVQLPATGVTDWMDQGFPNIVTSQQITPGKVASIEAGPYTIQVPADAFTQTVTFDVLTGNLAHFRSKAPAGQIPILAFAFDVKDAQGQLLGKFNKPVQLSAKDPQIYADSQYFNVAPDGTFTPNPTGLQVKAGELSHPISGTAAGWVVTSPASEIAGESQAAGAPDWTLHGFPIIVASQQTTPGTAATITSGPFTIQIPGDAFTEGVTFNLLVGDPATFKDKAPAGQIPILAFAFNVENVQGKLIEKFNKPITFSAKTPKIFADSQYFNVSTDGTFTANPTGLQVKDGELSHPIAGAAAGWVVTSPAEELAKQTASTPDWMVHGFAAVLKAQEFTPGKAMTISSSPYTIQVPADAFTQTVNILVLSGNPADYKNQLPSDQIPTLAFALDVENLQNQYVVQFSQPITVTVSDAKIVAGSKYFNVAMDGTLSPNPNALQVKAGEIQQSVSNTNNAWLISVPPTPTASPTPAASPTPVPSSSSTPEPTGPASPEGSGTPTPTNSGGG
jgi:hypothetical protein